MSKIELGPRPSSRGELAKWYSSALAALSASGLTVAEFARRAGVSEATLYLWRQRFRVGKTTAAMPAKLVEVRVRRPSPFGPVSSPDALVVRVCSGRRSIDVPAEFDEADLRRLVTVLESC